MLAIDHLFTGYKPVKLSEKVDKYSDLLDKVSSGRLTNVKAFELMKEATQEMPLVRKRMNSKKESDKQLASALYDIIKNIYRQVMGRMVYFTDEEDFEKDFARF